MAEKENEIIKEAKEAYEILTGDEEIKRLAEIRQMSRLEEQSALAIEREEGIKQGQKQEKIKTAKKLLKIGMPIEQIIEITELEKEEIQKIIDGE